MNVAAPACIMNVETDPLTGVVVKVSICANCEKANNETARLDLWRESLKIPKAKMSHGICREHMEAFMRDVDNRRANP